MARKIEAIKEEMTARFMGNETIQVVYGFAAGSVFEDTFSLVSIENIWLDLVSFCIWTLEMLFDFHKIEVDELILNQKSGTPPWYRTMALRFQFGFDLVPDKDYFDNAGATEEQIEASKIIKYAAVDESDDESRMIIKIAGETNGVLHEFTDPTQIEAVERYFKDIKWPGKITIINYKADQLYLVIQIQRDPLVLDTNGMSILNANYPIIEAIQEFMKELPFNGELKLSAVVDKLQKISGVLDATVLSASSAWIKPDGSGFENPQPISISKIPVSGYFKVVDFNGITYVV